MSETRQDPRLRRSEIAVAEEANSGSAYVVDGPKPTRQKNGQSQQIRNRRTTQRGGLSLRNSTVSIAVVDEHWFTRECIARSLRTFDESLDALPFKSCDDCLRSTGNLDLIIYHARQAVLHNYVNGHNKGPIKDLLEVAPVIILSAVDDPYAILKALEGGVRAYIPTGTTSLELTIEIIRLVRAGGTFVPASSLAFRRFKGDGSPSTATTAEQFTPRQLAVLHYLRLGKANKTIAHELALSEGTVKAHIRNIMKKMGVTNRTEVACRAQVLSTFA